MTAIVLLVGSNIDPEHNLVEAVERLAREVTVVAASQVFQTKPVGTLEQADFLNAAVRIRSELSAEQLRCQVLRPLEAEMGRVRTADKNAPRTIDLDVAMCGDVQEGCERWEMHDPEMLEQAYAVCPLAELCPDWLWDDTGETLRQIAARLADDSIWLRDDIALDAVLGD